MNEACTHIDFKQGTGSSGTLAKPGGRRTLTAHNRWRELAHLHLEGWDASCRAEECPRLQGVFCRGNIIAFIASHFIAH
jgi:hypothetical protein